MFMLRKSVYSYKYTDDWAKISKASLPEKEGFYISLKKDDVTDANYKQAERVWEELGINLE